MKEKKKRGLLFKILKWSFIVIFILACIQACANMITGDTESNETNTEVESSEDDSFTPRTESISSYVYYLDSYTDGLQRIIDDKDKYSKEENIEKTKDYRQRIKNVLRNNVEGNEDYVKQAKDALEELKSTTNDLIRYFETNDESYLSKAEEGIQNGRNSYKELQLTVNDIEVKDDSEKDHSLDNLSDLERQYVHYAGRAKAYMALLVYYTDQSSDDITKLKQQLLDVEDEIIETMDSIPEDTTDPVLKTFREMFDNESHAAMATYAMLMTGNTEEGVQTIQKYIDGYKALIPDVQQYFDLAS